MSSAVITPEARPRTQTVERPRPLRAWPVTLKTLRRIHLYLGMALLPWVLLYGVTALLFNHATWWSDDERRAIPADSPAGAELAGLPSAQAVAGRVVDALSDGAGGDSIRLVEGSAIWLGSFTFEGSSASRKIRVGMDPATHAGRIALESKAIEGSLPAWAAHAAPGEWSPLTADLRLRLADAVTRTVREAEPGSEALSLRRTPAVSFLVADGDRILRCESSLDGKLTVKDAEPADLWRDRLLRLHVQHGYPGTPGAHAVWAVIVDVMGVAMILWAATGAIMWWSLRGTRATGAAALVCGAAALGILAIALWAAAGL